MFRTTFIKIFAIFFSLFVSQIFYSQNFTIVNSITTKLNYSNVSDNYNIAIVGGLDHYKSTDQGNTWVEIDNNLGSELYEFEGYGIAVCSSSTYCMIGKKTNSYTYLILRTSDGGNTWNQVLTSSSTLLRDIVVNGNTLIATGINGIYRSSDMGLTWTFVQLSSTNQTSAFVRYNSISSSWVIGGYTTNLKFSNDDGLTWQDLSLGFNSTSFLAETSNTNGLLISKSEASGTKMILLNSSNTIDTLLTIPSGSIISGNNCKSASFLANNKLLTHCQNIFYLIDTSNQHVYHFNYPGQTTYQLKSFNVGANYGVALSSNSSGTLHRLYRIDLSTQSAVSVPSYFSIAGPGPCAGDNIVATANVDYSDSSKWYVNNVYVSSGNQLIYPTPAATYTTYNVKLNTYYQGSLHSTTKPVIMSAPAAPPAFTYTVDTTACYGLPLLVHIGAYSSPNTALKILYNGVLVYGPITMNGNQTNAFVQNVTTSGDLQIIMYKTHPCDQSSYTVTKHITVGPNLYGFTTQPIDSVVCVGVNPELVLDGTVSDYNYDFYTTFSYNNFTTAHIVVPGNSNGSLNVEAWGATQFENNNSTTEAYGPIFMYVHLKVTDTLGCAPDKIIDTIRIQRSKAYFELHSRSFLKNDTVNLSNAFITPNRSWSSELLNAQYFTNISDTIPLIIADTLGFFDIKLLNEPLPQCSDSMIKHVHYANQAAEFDTACIIKKVNIKDRLNKVKIDQFGNIYEISAFEVSPGHYPRYILRKNDAYGNLIWEKRASINYFLSGDVFGVVIEDIDFDEEGNPIIGLWIHSSIAYQDELINYSQQISYLQGNCYILKLDKNSGDVIWNASLYNLAPGALFSTGVRITDIVVDGNFVHASTYSNYNLDFFTLNIENGSLINTTPFLLEGSPNLEFIVPGFLFPFGTLGSSTQSYWSPQIDVLSTGEVVAVGNYQTCNSQNYPQLNIYGGGMFILKYHPDFGIYDVNKMAQTGYFEGASGIINAGFYETPRMFVDKNDNISVAGFWENNYWNDTPIEIKVFDSVLPMKSGSFIVNFDKDYNMNWLSIGTHAKIEDLAYIPSTNETYLAVKSRDNYSIGIGNSHIRFGEEKMIEMNYTHLPDWQYEWLNNPQEQGFIVKLNENGEPLEMKEINHNSNDSISQAVRMYIRIAGTACGDLAIYTDNANISLLEVDNHEFITDSILLILQYSNCVSDDCSYFDAENEIEICSVNGTIDIQLYDYFNLNSITYSIISGGIPLVTNQTSQVVNGQFSFQAPITSGDFDIVFSSPNNDTMTVSVQSMTLNFGSITEDTLCEYGTAIILGDNAIPSNGTYTGNGVSGLFFNPSDAGVGSSLVTYQAVDSNGCSSSIDHLFVVDACLGFEEIKSNLFNVNPNPFETELIVEITNLDQLTQIEVRDQLGRIVFSQQITELTTLVNLQNLANGNYIVEIECDNKVQLRKMILKN